MYRATGWLLTLWTVAGTAVLPDPHYNIPNADNFLGQRQHYFYQNYHPNQIQQLQRLEHPVYNPDAQFIASNEQKSETVEKPQKSQAEQPAKLETLEPDAEVIPGGEQTNSQKPPTQVPVLPQVPGLLPGQMIYIIHPQHQIYSQNPAYAPLPNVYRTHYQIPGYQRFLVVSPQGGETPYNPQGLFQPQLLIDPSGSSIYTPQSLFQQLAVPQPESQNQEKQQAPQSQSLKEQEQESGPVGQGRIQTPSEFVGFQPQFVQGFPGTTPVGIPFPGITRQLFNFPTSFNVIDYGTPEAGPVVGTSDPGKRKSAQGRNDDYNDEDITNETSTETTSEETKSEVPEIPPEPKKNDNTTSDSKTAHDKKNEKETKN